MDPLEQPHWVPPPKQLVPKAMLLPFSDYALVSGKLFQFGIVRYVFLEVVLKMVFSPGFGIVLYDNINLLIEIL